MKIHNASPLTPLHIAGKQNGIADIPSRSFGGTPEWHCKTDIEFIKLFNSHFPLPNQTSWQLYRIPNELSTRVISILLMKDSGMAEWRRLPRSKKNIGKSSTSIAGLWELTLTWRKKRHHSKSKQEYSVDSEQESEEEHMAGNAKLQLAQSLRRSRPLVRRFPWTQE